MKKLLLAIISCGVLSVANADTPPPAPMQMDPVCKEAFDHLQANRPKVEEAIKANDANKVGKLVIADNKYMTDFMKKNPQCKPPMPPAQNK